ncbi:hypothetical protein RchiOBHm_Chr2g0101301 [Rosa chinensis]|uniref:Uncharacterized protein n=1 Tax=Rosa chinensis TaxID=74649 RepID=A0A2P6RMH2_ROSCH|nr:uncharacterized protein LOC121051883 [Rosa chinensis]PRQ47591.1 hypothetical protein RchiOBHm_Chr2g0101301 [Rosa chinensis]
MAKISTLTVIFLVLWLAMSVGTRAHDHDGKVESWTEWTAKGLGISQKNEVDGNAGGDNKPTEEEVLGAWLNVLRGAEVALEANKFHTAIAMVAGVSARLENSNLPDDEKRAKFKEMLKVIEQAAEEDKKVKAIALINTLAEEFKRKYGNQQGGGYQPRGLLEAEDNQRKKQLLVNNLREAFTAIKEKQKEKAEEILSKAYLILKNNRNLCKEEKALAFLEAIHQTEQYLKENAIDKAEQTLQGAAFGLGIQQLQEQEKTEAKVSRKVGASSSEL